MSEPETINLPLIWEIELPEGGVSGEELFQATRRAALYEPDGSKTRAELSFAEETNFQGCWPVGGTEIGRYKRNRFEYRNQTIHRIGQQSRWLKGDFAVVVPAYAANQLTPCIQADHLYHTAWVIVYDGWQSSPEQYDSEGLSADKNNERGKWFRDRIEQELRADT